MAPVQHIVTSVSKEVEQAMEPMRPGVHFHTMDHVRLVVDAVLRIAEGEGFNEEQTLKLHLAALLHDTGYTEVVDGHEQVSVQTARRILAALDIPTADIESICNLILATKLTHKAQNRPEAAIRDADMAHLAAENYFSLTDGLRKEWQELCQREFTDAGWIQQNINFLEQHDWITETARLLFDEGKQRNLACLKQKEPMA